MKRRDAIRIKDINGMEQLMYDVKNKRSECEVFINQEFDVTNLVKFMEKNKEKEGYTYFHAFCTAFAKVLYNRPKLNRFIANRHLWEHKDVSISFVAKVAFDDKAEEIMIVIPIEEDANIGTIRDKVKYRIDGIRKKKIEKKTGTNNVMDVLGKIPNIIRVPLVGFFKILDKFGKMPKSFTEDNIYYSSALLTNIGSLGCGGIYHNNTNLGTCSSITAIGEIKDKEVLIDGKKQIRKMCEFGITFDERVADGFYMIKSMKLLQHILDNPEMLKDNVSKKVEYDSMRKK